MNLASILLSHATARPRHPAIIEAGSTLDHAAVSQITARYAARLARQGVGCGDRVGLALRDTSDHLMLHYAVAWLGGTTVPIDHRWTDHEKMAVARAFDCRCVIVERDAPAMQMPSVHFDPSWRDEDATAPAMADDENRPMMLSLSSGTTGRPSGSLVSHRELYERWISQWVGMGFNGGDRFLLATPLYFGAGRSFAMSFLAAGGTVIFRPPPVEPLELISAVREHEATILFLVPTQIRGLLNAWQGDSLALPKLRSLVTSGSAIAAHERRKVMERLTAGFIDYYGTSEGGGISVLAPHDQLEFSDSVGRPAFRVEIEIVDGEGCALPPGNVGRLRYRGPGVSRLNVSAEGLLETGEDGWLYPGDLARVLPSGHIQLAGRAKDMIIRGGINVYPAEIEDVLSAHPAIAEICVFGVADPRLGEMIAAAVTLRQGAEVEVPNLLAYARQRLASYKVPERIMFVKALPRNTSGKVVRATLARLCEGFGPDPIT